MVFVILLQVHKMNFFNRWQILMLSLVYELTEYKQYWNRSWFGESSESVQCAMLKVCDACADMSQLWRTVPIRKTFPWFLGFMMLKSPERLLKFASVVWVGTLYMDYVYVCDIYVHVQGLYRLFMLRKLTMSDNEITRLSNDLGQLVNLQELDVSRNGLSV